MNNDIDHLLNDLLVSHHEWSRGHQRFGKGYYGTNAACKQARASRQYDDVNGALDANIDEIRMKAFDEAFYRVPQPYFTALEFEEKNLASEIYVWRSPRLPQSEEELEILTLEARNILLKELAKDGVLF